MVYTRNGHDVGTRCVLYSTIELYKIYILTTYSGTMYNVQCKYAHTIHVLYTCIVYIQCTCMYCILLYYVEEPSTCTSIAV